ncbi:COMM domain-containing protein 7 [Lamellibrachia satsuma]|nr:COMM domain-containing protein 7 [Lamellibrachia satsuma]
MFNFTGETPPDSVFADIQALNRLSAEQYTQLTDIAINFLTHSDKATSLQTLLDDFSQQHSISVTTLRNIFKSFLLVPNGAMKKNLDPEQVKEDLLKLGLSEENAAHFTEKWSQHQTMASRQALQHTLVVNQLADMEWKFGVTAASSELNKVSNTFLQLKLLINKGNKMETVDLELTLPQFYSFLHEMERAKASIDFLS